MGQATVVLNEARYQSAKRRKADGVHYTPMALADFVAGQILSAAKGSLTKRLRILDPAVGDGELLLALVRQLHFAGYQDIEAHGFDTSNDALATAKQRLLAEFPAVKLRLHEADFLGYAIEHFDSEIGNQRPLFSNGVGEPFDAVIANPPYVRTQVMGAHTAQNLARRFGLTGRVDLYYAFINAIAMALRSGGILGIIVSNRFMTTKSGASVRAEVRKHFDICHVWDLGDTKMFEAAVLPAVLLMHRRGEREATGDKRFTSIYSCNGSKQAERCGSVFEALSCEGVVLTDDGRRFRVLQGSLASTISSNDVWRVSTATTDGWLEKVSKRTWATFSNVGKLRVGVKTTADSVFIRDDWEKGFGEDLPELLRPLITHHIGQRYRAQLLGSSKQILYPHEVWNGKRRAVDLSQYPHTRRYLESNRLALASRKYVRDAGREWFEIWVPHDPKAWRRPKLVWRDISERPIFWVDETEAVVNGDCYWMVCNDEASERLLWLAVAVGNSTFIEKFYDHCFNNKLYAGRRRFITQYVDKFPLPDPETDIARRIIQAAQSVYATKPDADTTSAEKEIDALVWKSFNLSVEEL